MKILRMVISLAVLAALVVSGVYVYRGCSDGTFKLSAMPVYASSAETNDSPIADLQRDPDFKISDYPYAEEDKSLQVLQIAENKDGGLYVYVYHPSGADDKRARALHMNMSVTRVSDQPTGYNLYALDFVSGDKTIGKYTVKDFKVKSDVVRYYDIASVTRSFIAGVDEEPGGDNTITEKAFPVGQSWTVAGIGDDVEYAMVKRDVVEVTSKYVGTLRYDSPKADNHIIAFSADRNIETLYEVEIIYTKQNVKVNYLNQIVRQEAQIDVTDTIAADHKDSVVTPNGKKTVYSWEKIQTASAFCADEGLSDKLDKASAKRMLYDNVIKHDWVVRFLTTGYSVTESGAPGGGVLPTYDQTIVFDTCILRLKYEEIGQVYDMGVVDDVQSGALPENGIRTWKSSGIVSFFKKLGRAIKKVFGTIWKIFSAPFKFVIKYWQVFLVIAGVLLFAAVVIPLIRWIIGK